MIPHLFHVVPGAHFQRMFGQDFNPHIYGLMDSLRRPHPLGRRRLDRLARRQGQARRGRRRPRPRRRHDLPRRQLARRLPQHASSRATSTATASTTTSLERNGSGYVARHGKDFLIANDPWFRGLELKYGPDGGVYLTDWSDTGECHDYDDVNRENGRIYKVTYGQTRSRGAATWRSWATRNWSSCSCTRTTGSSAAQAGAPAPGCGKDPSPEATAGLVRILDQNPDAPAAAALWALHVTGALEQKELLRLMEADKDAYVRGWCVQLCAGAGIGGRGVAAPPAGAGQVGPVAGRAPYLASALQRLPVARRWELAEALASNGDNAADQNLPHMIWYGIEPAVPTDPQRAMSLL